MKKIFIPLSVFSLLVMISSCAEQKQDVVVSIPQPKTVVIPPPTPVKPPVTLDQQLPESTSTGSLTQGTDSGAPMPPSPPTQTGSMFSTEYFRYEDLIHGYSIDLPKVFQNARLTSSASGAAMTFVVDMSDANTSLDILTFIARPGESDGGDMKTTGSGVYSATIGTNDAYTLSYTMPTDINKPIIAMYYSSIGNAYRVKLTGSGCTANSTSPQCEYYDWPSYLKNHIKFKK